MNNKNNITEEQFPPTQTDEQLLQYLNNNLSEQEAHELEAAMLNDPFMNDAVEGLQSLPSAGNLPQLVNQLNKQLHKQTAKPKLRRNKQPFVSLSMVTYVTIALLLLIAMAVYFFFYLK